MAATEPTRRGEPSRPGARPPWSAFRAALDAEGFRPTKGRGQNFLLDPNVARAIAGDARVGVGDRVLEVGPGCGFLSVHLAELGVDLLAVEVDPRLARVAARFLADRGNVRLLVADVLAGKHRLAPVVSAALWRDGPWHLVSNLPYAIAGPLLAVLARVENPPRTMTVLVQREVAERLAARPGQRAWGALSAKLALAYRARLGRAVGAQLFWPRPRVRSAVVRLEARPGRALDAETLAAYDRLVEGLFQRRRKTLRTALAGVVGSRERAEGALAEAGIEPGLRPGSLDPEGLLDLAQAVSSAGKHP